MVELEHSNKCRWNSQLGEACGFSSWAGHLHTTPLSSSHVLQWAKTPLLTLSLGCPEKEAIDF